MAENGQSGPGTFGCHVALHMAHVLAGLVQAQLCEHPVIQANAFWLAKATAAADALEDLHQAIARAHLPDGDATAPHPVGPEDESRGGHEAPGGPGPTVGRT